LVRVATWISQGLPGLLLLLLLGGIRPFSGCGPCTRAALKGCKPLLVPAATVTDGAAAIKGVVTAAAAAALLWMWCLCLHKTMRLHCGGCQLLGDAAATAVCWRPCT
jgi:hypothetical protein